MIPALHRNYPRVQLVDLGGIYFWLFLGGGLAFVFTGCSVIEMKLDLVKDRLRLTLLKSTVLPDGVVILKRQLKLTALKHSLVG